MKPSATEARARELFAVAFSAFDDGLHQLAEDQFKEFLEQFPAHERACEAQHLLGRLYERTEQPELALQAFRAVYQTYGDCRLASDARLAAARFLLTSHRREDALDLLQITLNTGPSELACEAGLRSCEILLSSKDWTRLETVAELASQRCPASAPTSLYQAFAQAGLGHFRRATEESSRALQTFLSPGDRAKALLLRGQSRFLMKDASGSAKDLEEALQNLESESGEALLARVRAKVGSFSEALGAVQRLWRLYPENGELPALRKQLLSRLIEERKPGAIQTFFQWMGQAGFPEEEARWAAGNYHAGGRPELGDRLLKLCSAPKCQLLRASFRLEDGAPQEALKLLEDLKIAPGDGAEERLFLLASSQAALGDIEGALASYGELAGTAEHETAARALLLRASLAAENNVWLEATVSAQKLILDNPPIEFAFRGRKILARAYLETGQLSKAAVVLEELLREAKGPSRIELLRGLGRVHLARRDYPNAMLRLGELLELMPEGSGEWISALLDLAEAQVGFGQAKEARETLARAENSLDKTTPEIREFRLRVAGIRLAQGSYNLAAEELSALALEAPDAEERSSLAIQAAEAYYRAERYDEAIDLLETTTASGQARAAVALKLGLTLEKAGRLDEATAAYERLLENPNLRNDAVERLLLLARRAPETHRQDLSRRIQDRLLALPSDRLAESSRFRLGSLLLGIGKRERGLALLESVYTASEVDPRWSALALLGAAYFHETESRFELAGALYRQLLARYPSDTMAPHARTRLMEIRQLRGEPLSLGKDLADRPPMGDTAEARALEMKSEKE